MTIVINRAGRKRKSNVVRDSSGKSRGEPFDPEFFARQPHRVGLPERVDGNRTIYDRKSERAGYALGRLWMRWLVSDDQHHAGVRYSALAASYGALIGAPMPHPKSGAIAEMVSGFDRWTHDKIDADDLERNRRIRQQYDDVHCALSQLGRDHHRGNNILKVVNRVCVLEQEWLMTEGDLGDLRLGLNAVGKVLIERD